LFTSRISWVDMVVTPNAMAYSLPSACIATAVPLSHCSAGPGGHDGGQGALHCTHIQLRRQGSQLECRAGGRAGGRQRRRRVAAAAPSGSAGLLPRFVRCRHDGGSGHSAWAAVAPDLYVYGGSWAGQAWAHDVGAGQHKLDGSLQQGARRAAAVRRQARQASRQAGRAYSPPPPPPPHGQQCSRLVHSRRRPPTGVAQGCPTWSVLSLGIMSGYWCRTRSVGNQGVSRC
jgi:hypothetical protein